MTLPAPNRKMLLMLGMITLVITLLLDQVTKFILLAYYPDFTPQIVVTPFFNIVKVFNYGVSFGMFAGYRQPIILIVLSTLILAVLCVWLYKSTARMVSLSLGLVIGGAIGNIIDRIRFGAVADFLDFHLMGYHWPAFNIADAGIFIGVVLLCIHSIFIEPKLTDEGSKD